jgi:DNA-binding PadR family transcriptional regulator
LITLSAGNPCRYRNKPIRRRLRDLSEKGLISESDDSAGSQRKLFSITGFGREVARAEARRIRPLGKAWEGFSFGEGVVVEVQLATESSAGGSR